ncbi:membrane protein [Anaerocolumna cellulosilytica]|uniref:Membrane protein n=1 Tax=Anaerocolumna cellulosilytica TaxID=433286 RepID=A0A6S6R1E1_9FIRM|nr:YoaK family protein [Anaerocolumna cellulosilytica]MBB5197994.1 uncharacterized membrane protein YoaK (UPF0700 family) [Anaerocolumna cellulosilytica]BCJ93120.1 membrane protein [Anaerocolumna cellulosilytica]
MYNIKKVRRKAFWKILKPHGINPGETLVSGCLLAIVGGFLDIYTYRVRGGVFANAQTGNIVLMAASIGEGIPIKFIHYVLPISAFILGVFATEVIRHKTNGEQFIHWRQLILLLEILLLFGIGFLPSGSLDPEVNIAVSFVCSLQVSAFRKLHGLTYATTMCTGNLRTGTEEAYHFLTKNNREAGKKALLYFLVIFMFIMGVILGIYSILLLQERAVWVCCILLFAVFLWMFQKIQTIK